MTNPFEILCERLENLENLIRDQKNDPEKTKTTVQDQDNNPLNDFIPKTEIRGVLASSSTLWKLENEGKLIVYGVGGKRYYKKEDIKNLFQPLNLKK